MNNLISMKNSNNNCFIYVIFETLFKDFHIYQSKTNSELINHMKIISKNIKNKSGDLVNSANIVRLKVEGNISNQGDSTSFFDKLCKLIKLEDPVLYMSLFGFGLNISNIKSVEHIMFISSYDDISWLDQKYHPEYICIALDLLKVNSIILSIIHGLYAYNLSSTIHHVGSSSSGHWYCYIEENGEWYFCDNINNHRILVEKHKWHSMPKMLIFKKQNVTTNK